MKKRLLFSIIGVISILAISIVAFASAPNKLPEKEIKSTVIREYNTKIALDNDNEQETEATTEPTISAEPVLSPIGSMDWDSEDSYLLAKIAMAEAENQDTEGKALVILVVLNRVWSDEFPNTIEEVLYQPRQFSPIANGRFDEVEPDEDCYKALELVQVQHWDESRGATYFESKSDSSWHANNLDFLFQHGDHYFYKNKE